LEAEMEETETTETVAAEMTKMAAAAMTETVAVAQQRQWQQMTETACRRGYWPVSSISETRIMWNITPGL
jgi:methionyl-tRNA formyltransferase